MTSSQAQSYAKQKQPDAKQKQPETLRYRTAGGLEVTRLSAAKDESVLADILDALDVRRGGVLSSGMDYPGRYSRWHLAYIDPCLELTSHRRTLSIRALNERGAVLLPAVADACASAGSVEPLGEAGLRVDVPPSTRRFTEEERSHQPTVFTALRAIMALFAHPAEPHLGLYGAFGYDLALQFEPLRERHDRGADPHRDLVLHLPDELVVVDRKKETCVRYSYDFATDGGDTTGLARATEPTPLPQPREVPEPPQAGRYAQVVRDARERFARGDLFEAVPSQVFHARCDSPAAFYERLRKKNPAPYEFAFNLGEGEYLVGASPEMYVRVRGNRVETCPIAGTIRRGADPLEDAEQIRTLLTSSKDESELTMCTDVDRNDKARVCVPGSVRVIGRRQIELYSRLIHTVDHVEGRLRPGFDALDAFLTHMWAVTVTGAPKTWAMQFIEDHEDAPRRWYGGAVGVLGFDGSANTGLTLRTAHIENGVAAVRVGATLLFDSDPDEEERETHLKSRALLETLAETSVAETASPLETVSPVDEPGSRVRVDESARRPTVLLVDHQDSFVHTLGDYLRQAGADVTTLRFGFETGLLDELRPDLVMLSPGPGRPTDFNCAALLDVLAERGLPTFGVCLGLQAMVEHAGGKIGVLPTPCHGKPDAVDVHDAGGPRRLLAGLGDRFTAGRYHSLYATPDQVPGFVVTATTDDVSGARVAMAIEHPDKPWAAVQFHPESILTATGDSGHRLIGNALRLAGPATATAD